MKTPKTSTRTPAAHYRGGLDQTTMLKRARELRRNQTLAEQCMWELLRSRRFMGLKFRRQHQYGRYILDFYCAAKSVAVELDGGAHATPEQQEHDRVRDGRLEGDGVVVVRIENRVVLEDMEEALGMIARACFPSP